VVVQRFENKKLKLKKWFTKFRNENHFSKLKKFFFVKLKISFAQKKIIEKGGTQLKKQEIVIASISLIKSFKVLNQRTQSLELLQHLNMISFLHSYIVGEI
jgi:hypothetical protein